MLCTRMYAAYELVDIIQQWYEVVNKVFATKNPWHLNL